MSAPQTEVLIFVDDREIARHILGPGAHTFGSSAACSFQIEAALVSRQHARLTVGEDGSLLLEDLGSTSGTFLDGQTIAAATPVAPNQIIQIGAAQILVLQHNVNAFDESTEAMDGLASPPELVQSARYELGPEIAKGGMGAVIAARQSSIRRDVALKVMLRGASAHDRLRFIEEAQITGQLEHPNIVPVHDLAFNEHGQPYYTMKLVKGSTLKDILKHLAQGDAATVAKYPLAALLTIFQKVCDAVAFAHARGVIHRDLKPANIMVGEYGEVLVMDWGLAKSIRCRPSLSDGTPPPASGTDALRPTGSPHIIATARDDQLGTFATLDGAVMGTPQYMSPEQARGEVTTLDERSDIFSLGAILYELVTLSPPFPGKTTRDILAHIKSGHLDLPNARLRSTGAQRPRHLPAGVIPDSLEAVISKALGHTPAQRYQRVADFQADLTAYQNGFATAAENAGAWRQVRLFVGRHRALSIAIAASILLLTALTAAFTLRVVAERNRTARERDRAEDEKQSAVAARKDAETAATKAREANAENLQHLHEASMADYAVAVQRIEKDNRWGEGLAHLARALDLDPKNSLPAMRLYGTITFSRSDKTNVLRGMLGHGLPVYSASFSPDGMRIVTVSDDFTARLWDAATGQSLGEWMHHEDKVVSASFSPDGTRIVTASDDHTARLWDAATGQPLGEPMRHQDSVQSASFSPDGTRIVTRSWRSNAWLWDAATGKPLGESMRIAKGFERASFSPDGMRIVTVSDDDTVRLWDAATGQPLDEPMRHEDKVVSASFSPDGTCIVTASDDHTARLWDAATGQPLGEPMRHEGSVQSASFCPDGTRIVTRSGTTARVWNAATGKPLGEPMRHDATVDSASFSPDGARIVTVSIVYTARLWDGATGHPLGEPMRHKGFIQSASFSPDGTRIVTTSEDNTARLWDADTTEPLGEPMHHKGPLNSASFSPDSTRIVTASEDGAARLWDAAIPKPLGLPLRHQGSVWSASFSPDSAHIVTASDDHTARVWDASTGKPFGEPMRHEDKVENASYSPDGTRIATASADNAARLWDAATGKPLGEPMRHRTSDAVATDEPLNSSGYHHRTSIYNASFSPDGTRIVTASADNIARLWDAATGNPLGEPMRHKDQVNSAGFSPDGTRIVTASADAVRLWDAATGNPLGELLRLNGWFLWDAAGNPLEKLRLNGGFMSASYCPDGTHIVTANGYNGYNARVWDAATGKPLGEPMRHEELVEDVSYSPDGKHIVTASWDNTARVWDAATGKALGEPMRHELTLSSASFSPEGTRIVTASGDTARVWDVGSILHLASETPEWVRDWARAVAGWRFDADGEMRPVPAEERVKILFAPHEGDDPWSRLARWVATDPATRTIHPDSIHTCREIAERERDFGSEESLVSALRYDPTVPLARVLLAKFEENPDRAAFLRDYDLKRLPDDASLWERAAKALAEQHDTERSKRALDKLSALAPEQARTLKAKLGL